MGPRGLVIFIPPAVDGEEDLRAEAEALEAIGFATHLYRPPYRRPDPNYTFGDPRLEKDRWHRAVEEFDGILAQAKARGFTRDKIAVIGRNLGGSLGSYVSRDRVACFIATGSVPRLSSFYARSGHPVAKERRKSLTPEAVEAFSKAIHGFDLASTIQQKSGVNVLMQFGLADPWIEPFDVRALEGVAREGQSIRWVSDDHAMNSKAAVAQRREWIIDSLG